MFGRILPRRVARPLGVVVVTALVIFLLNGVLFQGLVDAMNSAFSVKDDGTEEGAVEPTASERSGSPASLVPWEDLGLQGRNFVGKGPTPEELEAFSGRPAQEPVRAYVGLASAEDVGERAALAVRELERAGGFDRSVLVVVTTTGTGWVDPAASDSLEYEFNGDTAMVAMQYSYLPSWMSFLVDQVKARDAGRALFDAVYGVWAQLPPDVAPAAVRLRGEPRHLRRGGRLQRARRHREPHGRRAVGRAAQLQRAVARDRRRPRGRLPGVAAGRTRTAAPSGSPTRPPTSAGRRVRGASRGWSTCRTRRTPSCGGRRG